MNKKEITDFFDRYAAVWDESLVRNEAVINKILDKSEVKQGVRVLDIASGTGVLFADYISRKVASFTGVDISAEMVRIAKNKFPGAEVICADAEVCSFTKKYDVVMIYNAFPHFHDPEGLIRNLSRALETGGRLTVAHGMSEAELEKCHSGAAKSVSVALLKKEELSLVMSEYFDVDVMISDDSMYMVSGKKKC